jgi:hypothetical protein
MKNMKRLMVVALVVLISAAFAYAADATGKWKGVVEGRDGPIEIEFALKSEGEKVSGQVSSPMGEVDITEGSLKGDDITFTVATDNFTALHKGKISGDVMDLTIEVGDRQMQLQLKRTP